MRLFLFFFFILTSFSAFTQDQININGGLNMPTGQFKQGGIKPEEYGLAKTGYQLGVNYIISEPAPELGWKFSTGYGRNPIDQEAYKTAERRKRPTSLTHWSVDANAYQHFYLMLGPNLTFQNKDLALHLNAMVGGMVSTFPKLYSVAEMENLVKFEKERQSANNLTFAYNFNFEMAHAISESTSLNLTFGYFGAQQTFELVTTDEAILTDEPTYQEFTNDYEVTVSTFVIKTGIGFYLN